MCSALLKESIISGPNLIYGDIQTTSIQLPPEWAAGTGIGGLNDSPFVTLRLLCLNPHHSVPVRIFVHLCHRIWQLVSWMAFFPLMSLKDSECHMCRWYGVVLCEYWLLRLCVGMESVSEALQLTDSLSWKKKNESKPTSLVQAEPKKLWFFSPEKLKSHKIDIPYSTSK